MKLFEVHEMLCADDHTIWEEKVEVESIDLRKYKSEQIDSWL